MLRLGAHVAVEALQDVLPPRPARAVRAAIVVVLAVTFAAMLWLGIRYAAFAWDQRTPVLDWSTGAVYLAIPIGAALMLLHLAFMAPAYVLARAYPKDETFRPEEALL